MATGLSLDVDRLRVDTPGSATVVHLNNAGAALPPRVVVDTVVAHLRREAEIGGYEAHAEAEDRIDAVYDAIATLVGARLHQVALLESATAAWDRAFLALQHNGALRAGARVLLATSEYSSSVLPVLQLAVRHDVEPVFVPDGDDGTLDVDALRDLLDERVSLVAIVHAPSQNGLVNDVEAVGRLLRESGSSAWYLVDACQSVGQLPVDVGAIGCDFLAATGRKWLRGPRGTGFLCASEPALSLEPFPLDVHAAVWREGGYDVAAGARRFEAWEKSYAGVLGLGAAADYAIGLGLGAIRARVDALATSLRDGLAAIDGVTVHDRGRTRTGIVTFSVRDVPSDDVAAAARAAGVNVSVSTPEYARRDFVEHRLGPVVRASAHVYNTDADLARLLDVAAAAAGRSTAGSGIPRPT